MIKVKTSKKAKPQAATRGKTLIRPFKPSNGEYEDVVAIENANYPDALFAVTEFRFMDESSGEHVLHERLVAERNERLVGFITYEQPWWSSQEGKYHLWLAVDPDWHDTAVPGELYSAALQALGKYHPRQLTTEFREDQQYLIELFERQGFQRTQRMPISALDVGAFEEAPFASALERAQAAGIRIISLAELANADEEWQRQVWDLEWAILQDVPHPDPLTRSPFEEWLVRTFDSPSFTADGYFLARNGEAFVGMSSLWKSAADKSKLYTGLTGVLPAYRRQGIATALKVHGLRFAREYGAQSVETDNEENNPMLDLNKQLGFREKPAYVIYARQLQNTDAVGEIAAKQT